jgi:hypothetical protein
MMRRAVATLAALVVVVTACGGDDSSSTGNVGFGVGGDSTPTSAGAGAPGDDSGSADGLTGGDRPGGPQGPTPGSQDRPSGGDGNTTAGMPSPAGPPGSFAPAYLRPEPASTIVVELHSQNDAAIRDTTRDQLVAALDDVTGKRIGVEGPHPFSDDRTRWSAEQIRALADQNGRRDHGGGVAVMQVLLLRGEYEQADVIGVAVRGAVMAIFVDEVRRAGSFVSGSRQIEAAVVIHEAGHLMGLVDLYLGTGREDPDHPGHSTNEESVMYWAVESSLVGQLLGAGPPTGFDQDDRRDLAAIAGGAGPG